jgi:hypothetical protein
MKTFHSLSEIYDNILLSEAEKQTLSNPTNDEVGKLPDELFGEKPKTASKNSGPAGVKHIEKPVAGPSHKITGGSTSTPTASKGGFEGSAPAKDPEAPEHEEMEEEEVVPENEEEKKESTKKKNPTKESFTMSAFENLFKKTLLGEADGELPTEDTETSEGSEGADQEDIEAEDIDSEETEDEEESDLLADLKDLQDKIGSIIDKLASGAEDNEAMEGEEDSSYTEDDFDGEFGSEEDEEGEVKTEGLHTPKALSVSKGKALSNKKGNKVGRLKAKGGKAHSGSVKNDPAPKAMADKKSQLQKGNHVNSKIKKGEFFQ